MLKLLLNIPTIHHFYRTTPGLERLNISSAQVGSLFVANS